MLMEADAFRTLYAEFVRNIQLTDIYLRETVGKSFLDASLVLTAVPIPFEPKAPIQRARERLAVYAGRIVPL
jgi:hypothetical protein